MKAKFSLIAYACGQRFTLDLTKRNTQPPAGATKFYLRYTDENGKRCEEALGGNFAQAMSEVRTREARQEYEQKTGEKLPEKKTEAIPENRAKVMELVTIISDWLDQKRITPGIAPSTCSAYKLALSTFQEFAQGVGLGDLQKVTREVMFRFAAHLREKQKLSVRTVHNYFSLVMFFLKSVGHCPEIPRKQWGRPPQRKPQAYSQEQLDALFLAATAEEGLLFKSYLFSGMRNKELANFTYGDIDFKHSVWTVQPKKEWRTKSHDSVRSVKLPEFHTKDILERMTEGHHSPDDVVFPNKDGNVNKNHWGTLKRAAKRAGLAGRVDIHKFRSTCATMWLRDGVDVLEVARRLGHSNLQTVQQYIEMVNLESKEATEQTNKTFARFHTNRAVGA